MITKLKNLIEAAEQEIAYSQQLLNSFNTQEMKDVENVRLSCKKEKLKMLEDILFDFEVGILNGWVDDAKQVAKKYESKGEM